MSQLTVSGEQSIANYARGKRNYLLKLKTGSRPLTRFYFHGQNVTRKALTTKESEISLRPPVIKIVHKRAAAPCLFLSHVTNSSLARELFRRKFFLIHRGFVYSDGKKVP